MPSVPTVKVVLAALVMVGACVTGGVSCTVRVKSWTASGGSAVCSGDGEKVNTLRTSRRRAAQGGRAIVTRYKCYTSRQAAGEAEGRFRYRTPSRNRKCIGCSHDKSSVVHARDAGRSCDGEGEILCRCRGDPVGRCECESIVSE